MNNEVVKPLAEGDVKNELFASVVGGEVVENEDLDRRADKVANNEEFILVLKEYETIFRSKKKGIPIHSVLLTRFNKFKQSGYFSEMLMGFGVSKSGNYSMLRNPFLSLIFIKRERKNLSKILMKKVFDTILHYTNFFA